MQTTKQMLAYLGVLMGVSVGAASSSEVTPAKGPLRVHPTNPRYFTDGSGKAVYLTGSHHWNNLRDGDGRPFDYVGYLDFMQAHHHNFMRLWAWEKARRVPGTGTNPGNFVFSPPVYQRPGPGKALDGGPKFDLDRLNPEYFQRLRSRVTAARDRGIYVAIMLFQGWDIESHGGNHGNPWPAHPFHRDNNLNGIDGDPDGDNAGKETHTLKIPAITKLQEAYVRKVIDTVNDLDNVLYEITNEDYASPENTSWQYHMIELIHRYEKGKPRQHPVGMTVQGEGKDITLLKSPAEWISPGGQAYRDYPEPATGAKVVLNDTDHLWGVGGDWEWVWKCFLQGLNPIYMDPLPDALQKPWMSNTEKERESARKAMGETRRFAERMELATMTPHPELSSTRYCLANPGKEYLVYQPKSGGAFSVELKRGTYRYEWFDPAKGASAGNGSLKASGGAQQFKAPFEGGAVLYLKMTNGRE